MNADEHGFFDSLTERVLGAVFALGFQIPEPTQVGPVWARRALLGHYINASAPVA